MPSLSSFILTVVVSWSFFLYAIHIDHTASILEAAKFDMMEAVAREIRGQNMPFGGLQVSIICLDEVITDQ